MLNQGDLVVIKNRSAISGGMIGAIILFLCIGGAISLKSAWHLPLFWVGILLFGAISVYSIANMIFSKIVLDSPKKQMTVYNPFKMEYQFEDINYVDVKISKGSDGAKLYTVVVYICDGRRTVEVTSFSSEQASELANLLRGMLDNGAMEFPEGDEEPFVLEDRRFLKRKRKSKDVEKTDSSDTDDDKKSDTENEESTSSEKEESDIEFKMIKKSDSEV